KKWRSWRPYPPATGNPNPLGPGVTARSAAESPAVVTLGMSVRRNLLTHPTAHELDERDELAGFAREFDKPPGQLYLHGNSLGPLCRPTEEALRTAVESWRRLAILGWTAGPEPWFDLSRKAAGLLAPLLGADASATGRASTSGR